MFIKKLVQAINSVNVFGNDIFSVSGKYRHNTLVIIHNPPISNMDTPGVCESCIKPQTHKVYVTGIDCYI